MCKFLSGACCTSKLHMCLYLGFVNAHIAGIQEIINNKPQNLLQCIKILFHKTAITYMLTKKSKNNYSYLFSLKLVRK